METVLTERVSLLAGQLGPKNIKDVSRNLFEAIRRITELPNLGSNREVFALQFLVPALAKTQVVYKELRKMCSVPTDLGRGGFVSTFPASKRRQPYGPPPLINKAVRTILVLLEVRCIAAGVSEPMFGKENRIGWIGPAWASPLYVGTTKPPRQLALTTGPGGYLRQNGSSRFPFAG